LWIISQLPSSIAQILGVAKLLVLAKSLRFAKMFDHKQAIGDGPVYTTIKIAGFLNFNPH
jgi:hypothetical protein